MDVPFSQRKKQIRNLRNKLKTNTTTLNDWFQLGQLAENLSSDRSNVWGEQTIAALANLVGRGTSSIYQARKFRRLFSEMAAADLEGKLSWGQIVLIVSINDERQRRRIQEECLTNSWSVLELRREIHTRLGKQRHWKQGGRVSPRPRNLGDAMTELHRLLRAVVRWHYSLEPAASPEAIPGLKRPFDSARCPPVLRQRLPGTVKGLEELLEVIEDKISVKRRTGNTPSRKLRGRKLGRQA